MDEKDVVYEKRDFRLDEGILLPLDTSHRLVDGDHHVFLSVERASYIVTDAIGARFVRLFLAGSTVGDALRSIVRESSVSVDEASRTLANLFQQTEKNGFYESQVVTEDTDETFPILCYLTKLCNLTCEHCYVSAGPGVSTKDDLSTQAWMDLLSDYVDFLSEIPVSGRVTFTGGEPLVREDFYEIAGHAKDLGVLVEAFTNGSLIRDRAAAERLAACVDQVQISLDGATEKVNDAIRGAGTYRRILRAIRWVTEAGLRIRLAVTAMPSNANDIGEHLMDVVRSYDPGTIEVQIGLANNLGRANDSMRFADSIAAERVLRGLLARLHDKGMRKSRDVTPNLRSTTCGYGRSIAVGNDGNVYGCAIEELPVGNVKNQAFHEMAARVYQLGFDTQVDNVPDCCECTLRYFCNGGCRLNNFFENGDLLTTCCTEASKKEILHKLARRELSQHSYFGDRVHVDGFWF
jgi:radical SAM protein with 4Fe4S-binding SPASM domain